MIFDHLKFKKFSGGLPPRPPITCARSARFWPPLSLNPVSAPAIRGLKFHEKTYNFFTGCIYSHNYVSNKRLSRSARRSFRRMRIYGFEIRSVSLESCIIPCIQYIQFMDFLEIFYFSLLPSLYTSRGPVSSDTVPRTYLIHGM